MSTQEKGSAWLVDRDRFWLIDDGRRLDTLLRDGRRFTSMAAAIVDEWASVWNRAASLRVDGLLRLADQLDWEERF